MSYKLKFLPSARKQWNKLDHSIKEPLRKKLRAVLDNPQVPKNKLHGYEKLYKIKHRASGYRLVYEVENSILTVTVVMIGKREKGEVYTMCLKPTVGLFQSITQWRSRLPAQFRWGSNLYH